MYWYLLFRKSLNNYIITTSHLHKRNRHFNIFYCFQFKKLVHFNSCEDTRIFAQEDTANKVQRELYTAHNNFKTSNVILNNFPASSKMKKLKIRFLYVK